VYEFPQTSLSLIARVQELGDGASWAEFLRLYEPIIYRMALRRGLQEADARDVVQQVLLSVSRAIANWNANPDKPPFRAWLITITRNDILKSLQRRPRDAAAGSSSIMEMLQQVPEEDETAWAFEERCEIVRLAAEKIRAEFAPDTWSIFWQTSIEGAAIADVAQSMRRTAGSIYVARFRVLARLKEAVRQLLAEPGTAEGGLRS
jgi:RNA polymerase sigma-70 factor (ECF subfamily)